MNEELIFNFIVLVGGGIMTCFVAVIAYFLSRLVDQLDTNTENVTTLTDSFKSIAQSIKDFQEAHKTNTEDIQVLKEEVKKIKDFLVL